MKTKFIFSAFFLYSLFSAQNHVFQQAVNENTLSSHQKISEGLSKTYISTQYFSQPAFDLGTDLQIHLPDHQKIIAKFKTIYKYTNGSMSYVYMVENNPAAELVFSKYNHIVTGMYASTDQKVIFHQTDGDIFAVSVVSSQKILDQDSENDFVTKPLLNANNQKVNSDICSSATPVCSNTRIDVMVAFTPEAKTAWGGLSQSASFAATAVTNFNNALVNSGVSNTTINLVYTGETAYTESGDIGIDLDRFSTDGDGFMDDIHTWRTTYGADICTLITSTPTNICGLGYLNINPTNYTANSGFSVSLYNCAVSNYSMAHEMGHNMGLRHDWYIDTGTTPCSHHHGYSNKTAIIQGTSSTSSQRWRTIMAYNDECSNAGFNCTRINRWSNPDINYNAEPTGIAIGNTKPSNEAYGFSRFACVVSNFMPQSGSLSTFEILTKTEEFTLYPNPASETITISLNSADQYSFKIFNAAGQLILTTRDKTINVRDFASGGYFLSVYDRQNILVSNKKFIIK